MELSSDNEAIHVAALREGRRDGIRAVIAALAANREDHAIASSKWLCTSEGERAIDRELKSEDERRAGAALARTNRR